MALGSNMTIDQTTWCPHLAYLWAHFTWGTLVTVQTQDGRCTMLMSEWKNMIMIINPHFVAHELVLQPLAFESEIVNYRRLVALAAACSILLFRKVPGNHYRTW